MDKKTTGLLKDTVIYAIGNFGSKIILFLLVPLYTNYLSTEEYGSAEFVFTMSQLLYPLVSVCIYEGVVRMGLKPSIRENDTLLNAFLVWIVSCLVLIITTPLWSLYAPIKEWKWYLTAYTSFHILSSIELSYLKIIGKNKLFALSSILQTLVLAFLNIYFLIYRKAGVEGYLLANSGALLIQSIIVFVAGKLYRDIRRAKYNYSLLKKMIAYSAPLIINNISWWVIHSSDKIMIEAMLTTAALGLYTVATKIPSLINIFINIFSQAWGISSIKEMESSNDSGFYSKIFIAYSTLVCGCSLVVVAVIRPFMLIYVGAEFFTAWVYIPLLIVSAVFSSLAAYFGSLMGALQISKNTMLTTLTGAITNIVLNYVFIQIIGVWGAIIGTIFAYIIIAGLRARSVLKRIEIDLPFKQICINLVIIMIQSILVSLDYHIYTVSLIALLVFVLNNRNNLLKIVDAFAGIVKRQK